MLTSPGQIFQLEDKVSVKISEIDENWHTEQPEIQIRIRTLSKS